MELILRGVIIYFFLLLVLRAAGNRQFSEATVFDLVLLLIIAEVTQQALTGQDYSVTAAIVLIMTLVGLDIAVSLVKQRSKTAARLTDGTPLVLIDDGTPVKETMRKERVDEDDILEAARTAHGLERLDQVRYAILERNGSISIVPREG